MNKKSYQFYSFLITIILNSSTLDESESNLYGLEPICKEMGQDITTCWYTHPPVLCLFILLAIYVIREIFELFRARLLYFKHYSNYVQILNILLATAFLTLAPYDTSLGNHFGAWAVFLAWISLTNFLGSNNLFGKYIIMAFDVLPKVFKMFFVFLPSFLAFVFTFNMMLKGNETFHDLKNTMLKTFTMMTGEFEFDTLFTFDEKERGYISTQVGIRHKEGALHFYSNFDLISLSYRSYFSYSRLGW